MLRYEYYLPNLLLCRYYLLSVHGHAWQAMCKANCGNHIRNTGKIPIGAAELGDKLCLG